MKDDDDRLAKAAMKSLRVPAPEGLKADLKRMARGRTPSPSAWDALYQALSGGAWAYGAGAAFAAAAVGVFTLRAIPEPEPAAAVAAKAVPRPEAAPAPQALADLWSDDDGGDDDEI